MNKISRISGRQWFTLLLAGRLSNCLLFSSDSFVRFTFWECILSMLLNGVFVFLLFLPTVLWLRRGVLDAAYAVSRKVGKTVAISYVALSFFVLAIDIIQFSDFAEKTMKADFSIFLLTVLFIGVCLVASLYGIQALGRAAMLVAVFGGLCLLVFSATLFPEMDRLHFPPTTDGGVERIIQKAVADLPRTAEVLAVGVLFPYINGSVLKSSAGFSAATAFFSALAGVTAVGVLGDYAAQTAYPYYTAVTAAQIGVFERLDVPVVAMWLGTFFVRFTLFSTVLFDCGCRVFGKRSRAPIGVAAFVILSLVAFFIQRGSYSGQWQAVTHLYWWALGIFCLVLPFILRRRKLP